MRGTTSKQILLCQKNLNNTVEKNNFKGTLTRDFRPLVFFIKQLPLCPRYKVEAFLNIASISQRYSTRLVAQQCHRFTNTGWYRCARGPYIQSALATGTFEGNTGNGTASIEKHAQANCPTLTFTQKLWELIMGRFGHSDVIHNAVHKIGDFIIEYVSSQTRNPYSKRL
jgi:hypothetical protein